MKDFRATLTTLQPLLEILRLNFKPRYVKNIMMSSTIRNAVTLFILFLKRRNINDPNVAHSTNALEEEVRKTRLPSIKANTHQQTEDQTQQIDGPYRKTSWNKNAIAFSLQTLKTLVFICYISVTEQFTRESRKRHMYFAIYNCIPFFLCEVAQQIFSPALTPYICAH